MFNLDPEKMNEVMKQLGISQKNIPARKVVIEKLNGEKIFISNPDITKMDIRGKEIFHISGNSEETSEEGFSEDDVKTVMEKVNCSEKEAKSALRDSNGNLAEAILSLS